MLITTSEALKILIEGVGCPISPASFSIYVKKGLIPSQVNASRNRIDEDLYDKGDIINAIKEIIDYKLGIKIGRVNKCKRIGKKVQASKSHKPPAGYNLAFSLFNKCLT